MAKQDYPKDVGMWAVQPDAGAGTKDTLLNTLIPHFEKVWDGHSSPIHRACNILMSYGDKTAWGWLGQGDLETRAEAHAYAFGEWILRIKKANASAGGAGAPRYLSGIVFRGMWNLLFVPAEEGAWSPCEIKNMASYFLDYFAGIGTPLPEEDNIPIGCGELGLLKGYLLGDDFAKYAFDCRWNEIVQNVHSEQQARLINRPFYFTNQVFSSTIWNNAAAYGERLNNLKQWLNIFNIVGATPVFMPQFYPWQDGTWDYHDERDSYVWWQVALDELQFLKTIQCFS